MSISQVAAAPATAFAVFVENELANVLVTLAFLAAMTFLLTAGVFSHDDVLVASIMTLIATFWFSGATHRAANRAAAVAATNGNGNGKPAPAPQLVP